MKACSRHRMPSASGLRRESAASDCLRTPIQRRSMSIAALISGRSIPAMRPVSATGPHSWHIGNRVFARDLAMTIEGAIDRHAIPTREKVNDQLSLKDAPRPRFMSQWEVKDAVKKTANG